MGFFAKGRAEAIADAAIDAANPDVEPYLFMVSSWQANMEKNGKMALAIIGPEILKLYGCLPILAKT